MGTQFERPLESSPLQFKAPLHTPITPKDIDQLRQNPLVDVLATSNDADRLIKNGTYCVGSLSGHAGFELATWCTGESWWNSNTYYNKLVVGPGQGLMVLEVTRILGDTCFDFQISKVRPFTDRDLDAMNNASDKIHLEGIYNKLREAAKGEARNCGVRTYPGEPEQSNGGLRLQVYCARSHYSDPAKNRLPKSQN